MMNEINYAEKHADNASMFLLSALYMTKMRNTVMK